MRKKRYSDTFRAHAVRMVKEGSRVSEVAEETGASVYSIREWVRAAEQGEVQPAPSAQEHAEIRRLRKQVRQLEEERSILKKATAFFARERT